MRRKRTPRPPAGGRELLLNTQNEYFIIYRYSIRVLAEMRELTRKNVRTKALFKKIYLGGARAWCAPRPPALHVLE